MWVIKELKVFLFIVSYQYLVKSLQIQIQSLNFQVPMSLFQVHHDMTPDELRRIFHVDSHDQGMNINLVNRSLCTLWHVAICCIVIGG